MKDLKIENLGPITNADISLGDLTLLIGGHASGKSILLQLLKLLLDKKHIRRTLEQYGFIWGNKKKEILDRYFGEGMSGIWHEETKITFDSRAYPIAYLLPERKENIKNAKETLFYVPAQRGVCLQYGWPRFFTDYEDSVPYVLKHFSETLRQLLEGGLNKKNDIIFPQAMLLKGFLRDSFNVGIFHDSKITIDKSGKKRFKLDVGNSSIPFMAWSAGQKEFMPLLLSFYWLCPADTGRRKDLEYIIIEEPEVGLHPQAITSVLLQVMDLMSRGYKVIISTHSPVLLEFAWAFKYLQENRADFKSLAELFELKNITPSLREMLTTVLEKKIKTYYFDREDNKVKIKDISSLDAGSEDEAISGWGGLSSFSAKAVDIILKVTENEAKTKITGGNHAPEWQRKRF